MKTNLVSELGIFLGEYDMKIAPNTGDEILYKDKLYKVIRRRFVPENNEINIIVDSLHSTKIQISYE